MNTENNNLNTPKHTKRLGLARSSSMLKRSAKNLTGPGAKCRIEAETQILTSKSKVPQSDIKINYKSLEQKISGKNTGNDDTTVATPNNASSVDLSRLALSTNCRPYRLALSKKVREKMTKKRLEFYLANEIEKEESEEKQTPSEQPQNIDADTVLDSREELLEKIDWTEKELAARQAHVKKVKELKQAICIWKTGFSSALLDLQKKIEPRIETTALLARLHIPHEMIQYINE